MMTLQGEHEGRGSCIVEAHVFVLTLFSEA